MRICAPLAIMLLFSACGTVRPVQSQDSTLVEVKTVVETVHDTAYVQLPAIVEKVAILDTASVLENMYAKSEALVSGGILHHSLQTKAVEVPIPVENKVVYKDSLVYRDRIKTVSVEVEKPLTGWQQAKQRVGGFCFFLLILIGLYYILTFLHNFKTTKL